VNTKIKDQMKEIIEDQPDDSSYGDILRELAFHRMIKQGIEDSEAGLSISDKKMKEKINSWQK